MQTYRHDVCMVVQTKKDVAITVTFWLMIIPIIILAAPYGGMWLFEKIIWLMMRPEIVRVTDWLIQTSQQ